MKRVSSKEEIKEGLTYKLRNESGNVFIIKYLNEDKNQINFKILYYKFKKEIYPYHINFGNIEKKWVEKSLNKRFKMWILKPEETFGYIL
jgi:hypothetical protein